MGGTSTSTSSQTSQTTPWAPASGTLNGILTGVGGLVSQAGGNATTQGATNTLLSNYSAGNPYASAIGGVASGLLGGGGANANNGAIGANLSAYKGMLQPLASNTDYNPYATPGFANALATSDADIANSVNGQFAAAGRDGSPANTQALARGIAQGNSQAIANQYNTNVQNQQTAASNLYGAGNNTYGLLNQNNQTANSNAVTGMGAADAALNANNWGANGVLTTAQNAFNLPASQYHTLLGMVSPVAQAFGTTNSNGTSSQTMSPIQQLATLGGALGSSGGVNAAGQAVAGSGLLGGLGSASSGMGSALSSLGSLFLM